MWCLLRPGCFWGLNKRGRLRRSTQGYLGHAGGLQNRAGQIYSPALGPPADGVLPKRAAGAKGAPPRKAGPQKGERESGAPGPETGGPRARLS
jgi:hypothetical protein